MATDERWFYLLGKTGNGKSSTGNLFMKRLFFKSSGNVTSETKDIKMGVVEFGSQKLFVIDGPGLEDTDMTPVEDKETAITNVEKALALCYGGVDVFLIVFKFGEKFTDEERSAMSALSHIFGEKFMDHAIVVITAGDMFEKEMEHDGCDETFEQWWKKQTGPFREVCKECSGRVVLVNKFEKDELKKNQQLEQIVQLANKLHQSKGRYTSECFKKAAAKRDRLIVEQRAPILKKEFQEKMCLLNTEIMTFSAVRSNINKAKLVSRIQSLREEIKKEDKGFGILDELSSQMNTLESTLEDTVKMKELVNQLEDLRNSTNTWSSFGCGAAQVGGGLAHALPKVGAGFAVAGGVVHLASFGWQFYKERGLKKEMENVENKK